MEGTETSGPSGFSLRVRIAAVVLPLLLLAVMAEVGLRVFQSYRYDIPVMSWFPQYRESRFQLSPFLVFGPRIDYQIEGKEYPDLAYFDADGFRTNEPAMPKPDGEFRILAIGGSTTENIWNGVGLHWPLVLECGLRGRGLEHVRVLNSSMSGYSTAHSAVRLQFDLLDYEPDMVVMLHAVNDLAVTYVAAAEGEPIDGHYRVQYTRPGYTGELGSDDVVISRVWHSITQRLASAPQPRPVVESYDPEPGRRIFERNLRTIAALTSARDVPLVYLTMPFNEALVDRHRVVGGHAGLSDLPTEDRFAADMTSFNETILAVAETEESATAVDMATLMEGADSLFVDTVHYDAEGVRRFGRLLADALAASIPEPTGPVRLGEAATRRCAWDGA